MAANEQERSIKQPMSYMIEGKQAEGRDGTWQPAYEVRRELWCVRCGGTIAVGEHFTKQRHLHVTQGNRKEHPCCATCYPFVEVADTRPRFASPSS